MADPATRADVARLFGRAAFGATSADLDKWTGQEYATVVESLFPPGPPGTSGRAVQADEVERTALEKDTTLLNYAQEWWLERMRTTPYPLEERMTLFWHDHWATAYLNQPDAGHLVVQNQALRVNALGSFRAMANAMTVDCAMLYWLNGLQNNVNGVNENYAREFLELFTHGVLPQVYTETDIRQAARAFTGWTVNTGLRQATFTQARHTLGTKVVLGRTIGGYPSGDARNATEYQEVTEAALKYDGGIPASRFLAYKLVISFGYRPDDTNLLADAVIQDVAAALRAGDAWDIKAGVRTLLLHPGWRNASLNLVRSPVEMAVHAAKVLKMPMSYTAGNGQANAVLNSVARAGQNIFIPPSVAGWPNDQAWLSQATTLGRYEMINVIFKAFRTGQFDKLFTPPASSNIAAWTSYVGLSALSTTVTLRLQEYLAAPGTTVELDKQASMFILLGTSPDWQVM